MNRLIAHPCFGIKVAQVKQILLKIWPLGQLFQKNLTKIQRTCVFDPKLNEELENQARKYQQAQIKHLLTMHLSGSQGLVCVCTMMPSALVLWVVLASVSVQFAPPLAGGGLPHVLVLVSVLAAVTLLHGPHKPQVPAGNSWA